MASLAKEIKWSLEKFIYSKPQVYKYFKPLYEKWVKEPARKKMNQAFKLNGLKVLEEFDKVMTENGYSYTLTFGSMLGAVREHGFLKHDMDIDVAMWNDDYDENLPRVLAKAGFKLVDTILVDGGVSGREETYKKDGVGVDIFYFCPAIDQYPYTCCFVSYGSFNDFDYSQEKLGGLLPLRYQLPLSRETIRVPFEHLMLPIPVTAKEMLACTYGEDFMTPKPNWVSGSFRKYQTRWPEKKGQLIRF